MDSLRPQIALDSYLTPEPQTQHQDKSMSVPSPMLETLMPNKDSPFPFFGTMLRDALDQMDRNLPAMMKLQSQNLKPFPKPNVHQETASLFLNYWAEDYSKCIFSLCPIPNSRVPAKLVFETATDFHVAPDRATWLVHMNSYKERPDSESSEWGRSRVTALLKEIVSTRRMGDQNYLVKLSYELYMKQLIDTAEFPACLIPRVAPEHMMIYFPEILKTCSLVKLCFSQDSAGRYKELLADMLQRDRVQLVQLGLDEKYSPIVEDLQTDETEQRIRQLQDLIQPMKLCIETTYRNLLFGIDPLLDSKLVIETLKPRAAMLSEEEMNRFLFAMIGSLGWARFDKAPVAAMVADVMKSMLVGRVFPFAHFVEFLYDNWEHVEVYGFLFAEMQFHQIFTYASFFQFIHRKGYLTVRREKSLRLLQWLPTLDRSPFVLGRISAAIERISPDCEYDAVLNDIGKYLQEDLDQVRTLPLMYRYNIGMWLIDNATSFKETCILLGDLDLLILIPTLFRKVYPGGFETRDGIYVEKAIPVFIAHDMLRNLTEMAVRCSSEISLALCQYLDQSKNSQSSVLMQFRQPLGDIQKSSKTNSISLAKVKDLFLRNSHLCSLQIYDAFRAIRSEKDFLCVLQSFLADLLSFEALDAETLFDFFVQFCDSQCISKKPAYVFIERLISCDIGERDQERVNRVLSDFLVLVFRKRIISPSVFAESLFQKRKTESRLNAPLVKLFLGLLSERADELCIEPVQLTKAAVKESSRSSDLFCELLLCLQKCPHPIINNQLREKMRVQKDTKQGVPLAAAYYSLLPEELRSDDFKTVFGYFARNVDRVTSTYWTLWLQDRVYYKPGFPVTVITVDKQTVTEYMQQLAAAFSQLIAQCEDVHAEQTMVYLNCWALLCENENKQTSIASMEILRLIEELKRNKPIRDTIPLGPIIIDYLHPVLFNAERDQAFEQLCDGFAKYSFTEDMMEAFVSVAASLFVMFAAKTATKPGSGEKRIFLTVRLCEWLGKLWANEKKVFTFVLDSLNYLLSTLSPAELQNLQDAPFRALPEEVLKYVLVNLTFQNCPQPKPRFGDYEPIIIADNNPPETQYTDLEAPFGDWEMGFEWGGGLF